MSRLLTGILLIGVLAARGASRHKDEAAPLLTTENGNGIASAREELRKSIAAFGDDHPATAIMLSNLALAMREGGFYNYAEHYARQSLAILERRFGPDDVSLVPALNVIAESAAAQGRFAEARAVCMRAIAIGPGAEAHYGTALHNLAAIAQAERKCAEAAEYYREALAAWEKVLPSGHPFLRQTRASLGRVERTASIVAGR